MFFIVILGANAQSIIQPIDYIKTLTIKKGKDCFLSYLVFYTRFLSNNSASRAPTTMIATNKPAVAGTKYRSAADSAGAWVGAGVDAASTTPMEVSA